MRIALAGSIAVALAATGAVLLYLALRGEPRQAAPPPATTTRPEPRPPAPAPPTPLLVGVDDDSLKWTPDPLAVVRRQRELGARAVRIWVPWQGEDAPGPVRQDELARAEQASQHTDVVLAIFGFAKESPTSDDAQQRFCGYARAALAHVPDARAVVVWNEVNSPTYWLGSPEDYERLLARCYDALHAERPDIVVLDSTSAGHAPGAFLARVAAAYRASGRTAPLVDAFGHNPYPRTSDEQPSATHAPGFMGQGDYDRLVAVLEEGFAGTGQSSRAVWYLEDGFQTATPPLPGYDGHENAVTVAPDAQAERLRKAIVLAACQPRVRAFFNFELVDEPRLVGWQSGLLWLDSEPKPAATAFAAAAAAVRSGDYDCP